MKRYFTIVCLLATMTAFTQTKLSLQAGITHNSASGPAPSLSRNNPVWHSSRNGFAAGAHLQLAWGKRVSYEPGLFYMGKTVHVYLPPIADYGYSGHDYIHYLVLNQNLLLRIWGNRHLSASAGAGLYGAMALGGQYARTHFGHLGISTYTEGKLRIGNGESYQYRRFDMGGNLLLRVQYRQWQATAQFSPSFSGYDRLQGARLKTFALALGYVL